MIIGGALGNVMDRIRFRAVTDFLDFYIGDLHWPAFNLADVFVVSGVAILLLAPILQSLRQA
ncbi:Lipoprotein signal peptidase [Sulfitobacter noctilucae]|nr:Lipoprotein signal peptidase [Sulfitobacter noctilucae]